MKWGDVFIKHPVDKDVLTHKKTNAYYWDEIDNITQDYLEALAKMAGIEIVEEGGDVIDDVSEVRDYAVKRVQKRFKVKFPYVDENM